MRALLCATPPTSADRVGRARHEGKVDAGLEPPSAGIDDDVPCAASRSPRLRLENRPPEAATASRLATETTCRRLEVGGKPDSAGGEEVQDLAGKV